MTARDHAPRIPPLAIDDAAAEHRRLTALVALRWRAYVEALRAYNALQATGVSVTSREHLVADLELTRRHLAVQKAELARLDASLAASGARP